MHHPTGRREFLRRGAALAAAATLPSACSAPRATTPAAAGLARELELEIDERLSSLTDQRATLEPISAAERRARRARCGRVLAEHGVDAFVCEGGATMTWLAGIRWGHSERLFALVMQADGSHFWLCPAFEAEKARLSIESADGPGGPIVAWDEHEYPYAPLAAELARRGVGRIAVEPQLRHVFVARLAREVGAARIAPLAGGDVTFALRGRKDEHELALLRRANELTQVAIAAIAPHLRPGMNGREIGAWIDRAHRRLGFERPWNLSLIGAAAAYPHGEQDDVRLARGDVILIDTGASFHGYQSDNTRTWVFDAAPTGEVERAWNAVRDAQQHAFDELRPGRACAEIDRVARARIEAAGYAGGYAVFTHRLGHGIGLEGHEDPYFDGGSEVVLASGMTLSDEPGIYLSGRFGVRIEDIVAITAGGAEHFGSWQASPRSPA